MTRTVLLTGATGALGPHLLRELLRRDDIDRVFVLARGHGAAFDDRVRATLAGLRRLGNDSAHALPIDRLKFLAGDVCDVHLISDWRDRRMLTRTVDVVVHAAASTCFTASVDRLRVVNVEGTAHVLDFATRCRSLQQFLLVSTVCVAGTRTGLIPERFEEEPPTFVNAYEQTKWEAERLVANSPLPARIARLAVCLGGEDNGYVHRFGALHHSMHWLMRGLMPMMPGVAGTTIDAIATDVPAKWIARAVLREVDALDVCHVAAGAGAPTLVELLEAAVERLRLHARGRPLDAPLLVDRSTFDLFRRSVEQSGDAILGRVLDSAAAFLPLLLYPKVFATERAEQCWGGRLPHPAWQTVLGRTIDFGCANNWKDAPATEGSHV
jgi:nucleoside-diphosphate-sugar epimerase